MKREELTICPECYAYIPSDVGALGSYTGTSYRQAHANWHEAQVERISYAIARGNK